MLQGACRDSVGAVGDNFVVHMDRGSLSDFPLLGEFEACRQIRPSYVGQYAPMLAPTKNPAR